MVVGNTNDPLSVKFLFGGLSGCAAACVTNPVDVVKTRLQLQGELAAKNYATERYHGFFDGTLKLAKEEGFAGLNRGIGASLLREAIYSTIRLGLYDVFKVVLGEKDRTTTPFWKKLLAGAGSGAIGAAISTPTDLVKVRMQAQGIPGNPSPFVYSNAFSGLYSIFHKEGLRGLYKGVWPNTERAAILTASQLASYDHIKQMILKSKLISHDGLALHFTASIGAGFVCAVATSPVDVIKTRLMSQPVDASGKGKLYDNSFHCLVQIVKTEGVQGLFKGLLPNWFRLGPHTIVCFIVFEQLRRIGGMKPM